MAVAYERPISMRILIDCFLVQTNPNWELTIVHDGVASDDVHKTISLYDDQRIIFQESTERYGTYGHPNRKRFLEQSGANKNEFILLTNDDNMLVPITVSEILGRCHAKTGMVYWDAVHSHFRYNVLKSEIRIDRIDVSAFAVRADIAHTIGFINFAFNGDGHYAVACAQLCKARGLTIEYIPKPLLIHN